MSDKEKEVYLAVSLRGQAPWVMENLQGDFGRNYGELIKALEDRFSPANLTEFYSTITGAATESG